MELQSLDVGKGRNSLQKRKFFNRSQASTQRSKAKVNVVIPFKNGNSSTWIRTKTP